MKRRHKKSVIAILAIAALLYIGNLLIDNPYTHSMVNYYLNTHILDKLPIRADYQSMKLQLLPPAMTIYGIKVTSETKTENADELVSMSTFTFKISPWAIFMGSPQLGDIELKDLKLTWPLPAEFMAALNKLRPAQSGPEPPPSWPPSFTLPLSSVRLSNASVIAQLDGVSVNSLQDPKESTRIVVEGLNLSANFSSWKAFKIDLNATNTSLTDTTSSYVENGKINVRAEMRGKTLVARRVEISSPRISLTGKSNVEIKTKKNSDVIDSIVATINGENIEGDMSIIGSFLDIPGSRGDFRATTKTSIFVPITSKQSSSFSTTGSFKSKDARFADFRLYETESDFEVDLNKFKMTNLTLKIGDSSVAKGGGQINFDKQVSYLFSLQPTNLPFRNLMDIFNVDFDVINFDMTSKELRISGTSTPYQMQVSSQATLSNFTTPTIEYDRTKFPTAPACDVNLNLEINSTALFFKNSGGHCFTPDPSGQVARFPLNISGFSTFATNTGMDITMSSPQFNIGPMSYFAQAKLSGKGTMETRIYGPYSGVKISTKMDIKDASLMSSQFAAIKSNTEVAGGKLTWKDVTFITQQGGIAESPNGSLTFNDSLDIDFELAAKMLDKNFLGNIVRDFSDGQTQFEMTINSIQAKMQGPATRPLNWNGRATVNLENLRFNGGTLAKSVIGTIKGTALGYSTDDLTVSSAGSKIQIALNHTRDARAIQSDFLGGIGLNKTDQVEISATLRSIPGQGDDIRTLPSIGQSLTDLGISTEIAGDLKLAGTFSGLTGLAKIQLSKSKILESPVSDIVSSIVIDGSKIDIMAEQGGSALKARISLDFGDPAIPFNWYIAAKNADFRPWLPAIMSQDARNFAYLSATWNLEGTFKNWWDSVGELELRDLRIRYYSMVSRNGQRMDFRSAYPTKLYFQRNGWKFADNKPVVINSSLGELSFGLHNHRPPSSLGLTTKGHIDIETLKLLIPDVEIATGSLKVDGGIFGSIEKPNVDINVRDAPDRDANTPATIGLIGFRPSFQNIKLDARIGTNGITLKALRATKGNGVISAVGYLARPDSGDETDMTVNMDNASFLYPFPIIKYFDSTIDGQIKITGSERPWTASGRVDIVKARSNRDIDLREAILESIRSQSAADSTNSIVPLINMDISINAEKSISFSSKAGQATLSSDLRVSGSNIMPSIIGLVDVSKGRFFYKREFEIKRGLINFDDPIKVDPALDISASSDVSSYKVGINISGRASSPIIDFTVEPPTRPDGTPLSKIDIIGLLNRGSLPDTSSGIGTAESTAASEALNIAAGQVEDTVQKIFDLSGQSVIRQVYIDTYADPEGMPIVRFNLPLDITDDFGVILKVDQSTVKVSSEYSLHDSISLTGGIESSNEQTGTNSKTSGSPTDTGVDLKFKFAFP
jgi:hypothetical protein